MLDNFIEFLKNSPTQYHVCENVKAILIENGFEPLSETEDWNICEGGKYYVERNGCCFLAFTVGSLDNFCYKIATAHTDSPALKIKENAVMKKGAYATLNVERYGSCISYTYFDKPLKVAGRVIKQEGAKLVAQNVVAPFKVNIPSLAIHQNRGVNDGLAVNPQTDLQPIIGFANECENMQDFLEKVAGENVVAHDLFLVNADMPYSFGVENEFLASPRIDNLTSVYAIIQGLLSHSESNGVCVATGLCHEEIGSLSYEGAESDFVQNVLRRIAYALRFDDNEYYKALASSFLLSLDNAHAIHPNHPEKGDPSNPTVMGDGIVIKVHANQAYITDAMSSAVVKTLLTNADIPYQHFFNRSGEPSGSTLGKSFIRHIGVLGADIGIAQLAMHSSLECFAKKDMEYLNKAMAAYYSSDIIKTDDGFIVQ